MNETKGNSLNAIADLLFEAKILSKIPRAGFHFLGAGRETVAEHSFSATFIAYVMAHLVPEADAHRLIAMCLVHDLPEARTGDLNYVQKRYVKADERKAIADTARNLPFGDKLIGLTEEFNRQETLEARLAHDADQLAFILDLKSISDIGSQSPEKWLPVVRNRLKTEIGKKIAAEVAQRNWDAWWMEEYSE